MTVTDPDALRAQFRQLYRQRDDIVQHSRPLREERDRLKNQTAEQLRQMEMKIRQVEKDLPDIDRRMASISRTLGHRIGPLD